MEPVLPPVPPADQPLPVLTPAPTGQPGRDWGHWAGIPLVTGLAWCALWLPIAFIAVTSALGDDLHCRPGQHCGGRDLADLDAGWAHVQLVGAIGWALLWAVPPARGLRARRVLRQVQLWLAVALTAYLIAVALTWRA